MKGGISCILQAAAWATTEGLPVKVILGVDEENISQGANDLIRSGKLSDVGFLIVAESGQVTDFSQPISVCLGRKGRIVFEIEVIGMAAHAAEHHKGVNAIEKAAELCLALRELPLPLQLAPLFSSHTAASARHPWPAGAGDPRASPGAAGLLMREGRQARGWRGGARLANSTRSLFGQE
jgi:acetylornithine deacetylase/succinyl-diaminopimelate desuccinylase-like protein